MAAYAALVSLVNTIHNINYHPRLSTSFDHTQIKSLSDQLDFLLDFIETNSHGGTAEVEDLEIQVASATHEAEDVIESHIVDQILPASTQLTPDSDIKHFDLQNIVANMESIELKVKKFKEKIEDKEPTYSMPASTSSRSLTIGTSTMVGFDGYYNTLLGKLTGEESGRLVIAISGMVGIGKTTLARNLYERLLKNPYLDVHAWITVSGLYNVREILCKILSEAISLVSEPNFEIDEKLSELELGDKLFKLLSRRRYLFILDGMDDDEKSIALWEEIQFFLREDHNRSRVIITTRVSRVADRLGSFTLVVKSMEENESWELFCQKAFAQEVPHKAKLEEIGRRVVEKCRGLPLSIVVIGGLLGKSTRVEDWEYVENHINSIVTSAEEDRCFKIISLSYDHLPAHLKPCFLYMGIFPEGHEICVSQLIKLWIAEGFLKPIKHQSLEEIAKAYIEDLIDRNLVLVCGLGSNGKFKTCKIHDLLRYFCMRIVEKEKFLCVMKVLDTPLEIHRERRIIIHGGTAEDSQVFCALESTSLARSLICQSPTRLSCKPRLLRVLTEACWDSLDATFQQVNLRLLAYESVTAPIGWKYTYDLPLPMSLLWNVQTLIIDISIDNVTAPPEIWEMQQLRHLQFRKIFLPDPPPSKKQDDFILRNLQTLGTVLDFKCSEEVCWRMSSIKKLRISYDDFSGEGSDDSSDEGKASSRYNLANVGNFKELESLCYCFNAVPDRDDLLDNLMFPDKLKRLTLESCELQWRDLAIIGSLHYLEVLKLKQQSVRGRNWNAIDGQFKSLTFLEIDTCYLISWNAECSHFPALRKLVLRGLSKLVDIPFSETSTLEDIHVIECSMPSAISAIRILDDLEENESDGLRVRIEFSKRDKIVEFQERVKQQGFKTQSFQIGEAVI